MCIYTCAQVCVYTQELSTNQQIHIYKGVCMHGHVISFSFHFILVFSRRTAAALLQGNDDMNWRCVHVWKPKHGKTGGVRGFRWRLGLQPSSLVEFESRILWSSCTWTASSRELRVRQASSSPWFRANYRTVTQRLLSGAAGWWLHPWR